MSFFSVIIPLYNKEAHIKACLNSVVAQTFNNYEIIIVNDGSTDNSVAIVEGYKSKGIKLFHQKNSGVSIARNNGVEYAQGKYIAFLDADDIWKREHLECLKQSIDKFPKAVLYSNNYEIRYNSRFIKPAKLNLTHNNEPFIVKDFFKASINDTICWTSATAISKKDFSTYDGFNLNYTTGQDLDLWIRIALKATIVFNPRITMQYNKSISDSLSKSEKNEVRYTLFNSFKENEKSNHSLKKYLDQKRYGLALRTKILGEKEIYNKAQAAVDFKNLNTKQKLLLSSPSLILKLLNKIRPYIVQNSLYLRLFKS